MVFFVRGGGGGACQTNGFKAGGAEYKWFVRGGGGQPKKLP